MIRVGDCLEVMRTLDANSVDAVVCDPPYGLEFMGKDWDAPWKATSGGFAAPGIGEREREWPSYQGSNLSRCVACGLLVGQGGSPCRCENPQPKRQDAERMRLFQAWCEAWARECLRVLKPGGHMLAFGGSRTYHRLACAIEDAGFELRDQLQWIYGSGFPKSKNLDGEWQGWGTALKPAHEPIALARKPLIGTVAANVAKYGTGALNIDGCRVGGEGGRWPANLVHDGSDEVVGEFPKEAGAQAPVHRRNGDKFRNSYGAFAGDIDEAGSTFQGDTGSAARFFYCAKASRKDRNDGCEAMPERPLHWSSGDQNPGSFQAEGTNRNAQNNHPTVKPTDLMRWLCRLVTPPGGLILDPFTGSGSTGRGAIAEGFRFIGIEREPDYAAIAEARIAAIVERQNAKPAEHPQASLFEEAAA